MEALWALVFHTVPGSVETTLTLLRNARVSYDEDEKVTLQSHHIAQNQSLRQIWAKSLVREEIDRMVTGIDNDEEAGLHQVKTSTSKGGDDHLAPASEFDAWVPPAMQTTDDSGSLVNAPATSDLFTGLPLDQRIDALESQNIDRPSALAQNEEGSLSSNQQAYVANETGSTPAQPSLPANAWELLEIYFSYTHCLFPIIPKHDLVRILSSYQDDPNCDSAEVALLWAVFTVATAHGGVSMTSYTKLLSHHYYRAARDASPGEDGPYLLGHARTSLLLAMFNMAELKWEHASLLVGHAVRILLLCNGICNANTTSGPASAESTQDYKRTLLGAFALDTMIAARLRIVPHLRSEDVAGVIDSLDENGPEEWDQWSGFQDDPSPIPRSRTLQKLIRALSTYKQFIKIVVILNNVVCSSSEVADGQGRCDKWTKLLNSWLTSLPKHCRLDLIQKSSQPPLDVLPPLANLCLMYDIVVLYMQAKIASASFSFSQFSLSMLPQPSSRTVSTYVQVFGAFACQGILDVHATIFSEVNATRSPNRTSNIFNEPIPGAHYANEAGRLQMGIRGRVPVSNTYDFESRAIDSSTSASATNTAFPISTAQDFSPLEIGSEGLGLGTSETADQSMFDHFDDPGTIKSLLAELSTTQDNEWNIISSQFMYNLGFYDNETQPP